MEVSSDDIVKQYETPDDFNEYNENNKIVNDIGYSYYINHNNKNMNTLKSSINNNEANSNNTNTNNKRRYNSQLTNINENMDNTLNVQRDNSGTINQINNETNTNNFNVNSLLNSGKISTVDSIRLGEIERKKILLDNIQSQISLRKKTKLEELKQRQEEDAQYLKDMIIRYPFGRGGGGAPIRDKSGKILTHRRNLISNLKYNQAPINVDDDYDEVWGKEKRIGRFYVNGNQNINNDGNINNISNEEDNTRPFSTNPRINSIKNTNLNFENYQNQNNGNENINNSPLKLTYNYSTNKLLNSGNNLNNINNLNYSNNLLNYDNILYRKILERKRKELELQKELEAIQNDRLNENYLVNQINNSMYRLNNNNINNRSRTIDTINRRTKVYNNIINEDIKEDINEDENTNIRSNEKKILNKNDYYDNYNFVPKGQIHPRLENSFLFSDELNKLRNEIRLQQNDLFDKITDLKGESEKANEEKNKILKDLELIKSQLNRINNKKNNEEGEDEDNRYDKENSHLKMDEEYDKGMEKMLKSRKNDDYYYIDNSTFKRYENELPNTSSIEKEVNILNTKKHYTDQNQLELEELIKKSHDILENLKENEKIEKEYSRKPDDYFDTSDHFYHTYRLNHPNDFDESHLNYNNNLYNNQFENGDKDDVYEVKIEKI